ncbi:hypothetical protein N7466_003135 [Penicillium verhagenii]|uniref:uncharacterized protein n=1 Tax=Penicillium verhagenii TaxID=1562060 RepID=UPI002544DA29|nr:uncharacterized protein N7466_003135 [Penicillium verhagenii]KAJ5936685.1 hypothetical protein N7466_003135 [Penicillium verhagenii]
MRKPEQKPWLFQLRSSETFLVLTVSIAIFTDSFIYGVIVPVIPVALIDRVGARPEDAQYLVSILLAVYGGTLLAGSPIFGYLADRCSSRKIPFVLGLVALGTSTALFAWARTFAILVVARTLQGFSAAAVWVVGLAIVADNVPSERISAALGTTTIGLTWGFLLGPMISGYVYDTFGYYGCYVIPVVLIVVDVVLRFAMIEVPKREHRKPKPELRAGSDYQNGRYDTFSGNDARSPARVPVREYESETEAPLLQSPRPAEQSGKKADKPATVLRLLITPRLPLALVATTSVALTLSALETSLPLFVMDTFAWTAQGAGFIFFAITVPSFAAVQIGHLIDSVGVRTLGAIAFAVSSCTWIALRFITENSTAHIVLLVLLLLILGFTIVTIEIVAMTEVSQVISDYEAEFPGVFGEKSPVAQAYALFNMSFAAGQLLGPLVAGAILVNAGWGMMTLILGIVSAVTALPFGIFSGPRKLVEAGAETGDATV